MAAYAFTTVGVNAGYFGVGEKKVQVLDVPGTLARVEKMNEIEKIAYLVVKELAEVVVYVFDLSGEVSLKKQEELFKQLRRNFKGKILIYLSKRDIIEEGKVREFKEKCKGVFDVEELKKEMIKFF